MAASDLRADKILVKGIPSTLHPDKLTIYFQKHKVGGGDVSSVTFPVSKKEPDVAIVAFDDPQTVASVLARNHTIGGATVTLTALKPEPQIFDDITAKISDFTINCIKSKHDVDEILDNVSDSTGCIIENVKESSKFVVKGKWYQVQAAFERLEYVISKCIEKATSEASPNGYLSRTTSETPTSLSIGVTTGHHVANLPHSPRPTARPQKVVVSVVVDKDIYAYMELVHSSDLDDIRLKFKVSIKTKVMGDAMKVEFVATGPDGNGQNAVKALEELSTRLNQEVGQDVLEIDASFPEDELQRIFSMLRPEFPMVHMDKTDSSPDHIMFIAPNSDKCKMAMEMFKYYYDASRKSKQSGSSDVRHEKCIDKDVYEFIQLSQKADVVHIWDSNGVSVTEKVVDDTVYVSCQPKNPDANPKRAIDQFERLYAKANKSSIQRNIELKNFRPVPTDDQRQAAIDKTRSQYPVVHIAPLFGDYNFVIFIAATSEACESAMTSFRLNMNAILRLVK